MLQRHALVLLVVAVASIRTHGEGTACSLDASQTNCPPLTHSPNPMGPLAGVKVIFDGVMFRIHHGKMFGINKMWSNIVPFMAKAVRSLGGTFTHCQSSWADEYGNLHVHELEETQNEPFCDQDFSTAVQQLKGEYTLVFSSYFRRPVTAKSDNVCYFLPVYDFTPEILNSYHGQPPEFYMKNDSIANANGFLSLSDSTTRDLLHLHPFVDAQYVATSPNRVSASFSRVPASAHLDMQGLKDGDLLEMVCRKSEFSIYMYYDIGILTSDSRIFCICM
mmetsp:Transcript_80516/g.118031  ORF Transcript_80516/g.118031 Transcript_80516/m.118031 type:complete len:277 (+) Transcript_80516:88-918(+)